MPNHCNNTLLIEGPKEVIADFVQRVTLSPEQAERRGQKYDILMSLYPTPQELVDTKSGFIPETDPTHAEWKQAQDNNRAKYGYVDWYDWNCAKWGTKWGDYGTYLTEDDEIDTRATFVFDSAWAPPIEGIAHVATMFPDLKFALSYNEGGMGFYGFCVFSSDGDYDDNCQEYDNITGYAELVNAINNDGDEQIDVYEKMDELVMDAISSLETTMGW